MQQFFINDINQPSLSKDQVHQVTKVLRSKVGDRVRLVDKLGQGAIFEFLNIDPLEFKYVEPLEFTQKKYYLKLIASLIRSERLEWMIQKACESGVDEIVLYAADHGVVRDFGKREDRKFERLNTIALEACEQAYRQHAVTVRGIISKNDIGRESSQSNMYADIGDHKHLVDVQETGSITIVVGPEGGFSDAERDHFNAMSYKPVSLGSSVFRAETASIAICNFVSLLDKE